jgi:hypothetical protein
MVRFTLITLLATLGAVRAQVDLFVGRGTISVLNSSDWNSASPSDSIGCLDSEGYVTTSDCATFTRLGVYPYSLSTTTGNCTFLDTSAPVNSDSAYGSSSHAWRCVAGRTATVSDELYTIVSSPTGSEEKNMNIRVVLIAWRLTNHAERIQLPVPLQWGHQLLLRHKASPGSIRCHRGRMEVQMGKCPAKHHPWPSAGYLALGAGHQQLVREGKKNHG